jgi:hypothetical protein
MGGGEIQYIGGYRFQVFWGIDAVFLDLRGGIPIDSIEFGDATEVSGCGAGESAIEVSIARARTGWASRP